MNMYFDPNYKNLPNRLYPKRSKFDEEGRAKRNSDLNPLKLLSTKFQTRDRKALIKNGMLKIDSKHTRTQNSWSFRNNADLTLPAANSPYKISSMRSRLPFRHIQDIEKLIHLKDVERENHMKGKKIENNDYAYRTDDYERKPATYRQTTENMSLPKPLKSNVSDFNMPELKI